MFQNSFAFRTWRTVSLTALTYPVLLVANSGGLFGSYKGSGDSVCRVFMDTNCEHLDSRDNTINNCFQRLESGRQVENSNAAKAMTTLGSYKSNIINQSFTCRRKIILQDLQEVATTTFDADKRIIHHI